MTAVPFAVTLAAMAAPVLLLGSCSSIPELDRSLNGYQVARGTDIGQTVQSTANQPGHTLQYTIGPSWALLVVIIGSAIGLIACLAANERWRRRLLALLAVITTAALFASCATDVPTREENGVTVLTFPGPGYFLAFAGMAISVVVVWRLRRSENRVKPSP